MPCGSPCHWHGNINIFLGYLPPPLERGQKLFHALRIVRSYRHELDRRNACDHSLTPLLMYVRQGTGLHDRITRGLTRSPNDTPNPIFDKHIALFGPYPLADRDLDRLPPLFHMTPSSSDCHPCWVWCSQHSKFPWEDSYPIRSRF